MEGGGCRGSVVAVEGYAGEVFGAVGEAVEGDAQRGGAGGGKDVGEQAVRHIGEVCVGIEFLHSFGADCRIVGDVAEAFLFDAFVGGNHNE